MTMSETHKTFGFRLKRLTRDADGTSAIEFAIIAPILLVLVAGLSDVNDMAFGASNMQSAVRAGIQYALKGGSDTTTAQAQADAAWTRKPGGGTVSSSSACQCAGSAHACDTLCDDSSIPELYMTVTATATLGGNLYSTTKTVTETVRIR